MVSAQSVFEVPSGSSAFGDGDKPVMKSFKICEKTVLNHDSYLFKFTLDEGKTFGVPIGGCAKFFTEIAGEEVGRSYTPTTDVLDKNTVDFVIKVYRPTDEFPEGGKMTRYLESLNVGDEVKMKGPLGRIRYSGNGLFNVK